ncbi:aminopeptidase P family protein [Thalassobacter stenotrophicus]|uniref:Xaa-Pro dipeptidase n=2 Tax=Thalassobacter stenotrophicus TaxID=266809 RepID=A0A0P1F1J7_9RHOB|nr:aminopeptidase P family protein [Thalassobacter stenotrophicus]PVZ48494.1 aminopeptidase P family protein [Thalassobacter stenotrophicus]CUH61310.1 Xaa-Pro dipeptidase [Thalassobacter stenotrophicus]SHI62254.1 Xaa-Pro aminopeptidase [Thalassobacter stenotrophicus DSM 16310]
MFQDFSVSARPENGPPRLEALRRIMEAEGVDGFLIPRADVHQGEYVAPCDDRLAWLTGFTGSAGFCAALRDQAGVFVDGRYRVQVKHQVDLGSFTPVHWPETGLAEWLTARMAKGQTLAIDPWLHTVKEGLALATALEDKGVDLRETDNLLDRIWQDRPAPPTEPVMVYPDALAGRSAEDKRTSLAADLRKAGQSAAVLTLPDSLNWLLNIRGADIPRNPIAQCLGILHDDGTVTLFIDAKKLEGIAPLEGVTIAEPAGFAPALSELTGKVAVDYGTAPLAVYGALMAAGATPVDTRDPCALPKAAKTDAEITATRTAHLRDASAVVKFLAWLDSAPKDSLSEIDVVTALEGFRRETNALRDISFETICGSGPNGAIMHYRVTKETNRPLADDTLLLVDSGGQYLDGTTDITRTMALREPGPEERTAYTQVLQGLIAISRARFPKGVAGAHLDALARAPLWAAGRDFDHGTGHGVGVYLSVHEGPQRLSRVSDLPLQPGMILSNEPGYYLEGRFGIRLENLIVVQPAPALPGGDPERTQYAFETLTFVPFDRRLIDVTILAPAERDWLDAYHGEVLAKVGPQLDTAPLAWLTAACAPL